MKLLISILLIAVMSNKSFSQTPVADKPLLSPKELPGKGLAQYDFFYAGEGKMHNMYIIKGGQIAWAYNDTATTKGEISDAVLMTNGNILFAHQYGITLIDADKKVLWHRDAPKGHEIHTAQPIGKKYVVYVENGDTGRVKVVNVITDETVKEFMIPVGNTKGVHGQFRHARLTKKGTLLVAHMDMGVVAEYNFDGKQLNTIKVPGVWGVTSLANGSIITCGKGVVRIISPKGDSLWGCVIKDISGYTMPSSQLAIIRPNGNIVINDWFNQWNGAKVDKDNLPVQFLEITPDKKPVWALREWEKPNLGPATIIQFLDDKNIAEKVFFGNIK